MEDGEVIRLIEQYLHEHGFRQALAKLEKESGRRFDPNSMVKRTVELQEILDDYAIKERKEREKATSVTELFPPGDGTYAGTLWTSLDTLTEGNNVLAVRLIDNGALALGASKSILVTAKLPVPLVIDTPPEFLVSNTHIVCKGAILSVDFHPQKRNLILCGSMDCHSFILDTESVEDPLVQKFKDHRKYVVKALWSPTGKRFVTASYDKSVIGYSSSDEASPYEMMGQLSFKGAVECMAMAKDADVCVVGVRDDHLLHCLDLSNDGLKEFRQINLNALGDDYVSFTAMYTSFSHDGRFILVSTDRDRLIIYSWEHGKQIANFYGATNDELSQPRHCWDPSGRYIYATSRDNSICVWEICTQKVVKRLTGHSGTVRDLHYCGELGMMVSGSFDGSVKFWRKVET